MAADIPVVDFLLISDSTDLSSCPQVKELHSGFSTVGFVFLKNHGIDRQLISEGFVATSHFFSVPDAEKQTFNREGFGPDGYTCVNAENSPQPNDLKEFYDICDPSHPSIPDLFGNIKTQLYSACSALAHRILLVLGITLELKDHNFFVHAHNKMGQGFMENYTFLRLLNYPPVTVDTPTGRDRCAEHLDYGSFSLLFQERDGGLQVKLPGGDYTDVPYIEGHVLVILGKTMGAWTDNIYKPVFHRVPVPLDHGKKQLSRQSMAFFVHPNSDVPLQSCEEWKHGDEASTLIVTVSNHAI